MLQVHKEIIQLINWAV